MAIEFNYYNFRKRNQVKYEVDIDLSGLDIKSNPTVAIIDEDTGIATETNLDEVKDEKVNFVYTGAVSDLGNSDNNKRIRQGSAKEPLREYIFRDDVKYSETSTPIYTAGEAVIDTQSIDYGRDSVTARIITEGNGPTGVDLVLPTYYDIGITPRHELMKSTNLDDYSDKSTVTSNVDILAALNLWSNGDKAKADSSNGYIDKKSFISRVSSLQSQFKDRNIDIEVVEYPKLLGDDGTDINDSGLERGGTKVGDLDDIATSFISQDYPNREILQPLTDDNIVPFTMSIKEGFRGWYRTKEELYTDYINTIEELSNTIMDFPLASLFMETDDLESLGYTEISNTAVPDGDDDIVAIVNGATVIYPQTAYTNDNPDSKSQDDVQITQKNSPDYRKLYQIEFSKNNERWEFVYKGDPDKEEKVFITEMQLSKSPIDVYSQLINAQKALDSAISTSISVGFVLGGVGAAVIAIANLFLNNSGKLVDELNTLVKEIIRYEKWTNESVFPSSPSTSAKFYFTKSDTNTQFGVTPIEFSKFEWDKKVARVLVPVDFGFKRVKKKKKVFGFSFTSYEYEDLGLRWMYVNLIDTSVFTSYRKSLKPSGKQFNINEVITDWSITDTGNNKPPEATITIDSPVDLVSMGLAVDDTQLLIEITDTLPLDLNGIWQAEVLSETTFKLILDPDTPTSVFDDDFGILFNIIVPYEKTQRTDEKTPVRIDYNIPYLPTEDKLRDLAFDEYGPFDQSEFAVRTRSGGDTLPALQSDGSVVDVKLDDIPPGWEVFRESSKKVEDMREGIDIYDKVNFLLRILSETFGESRVKLIETTRSHKDQNFLQLGGDSSNFLSWHNFGLAARIIITQGDNVQPIEEGSADFWKLFEVAEAYTIGSAAGNYGEPSNIVWCARLVAGSDIFDWEFLPIGVGHKDAWKFRDASYAQLDPYYANAFVNVDRLIPGNSPVNVLRANATPPTDGSAYIFENSKAYKAAIVINGEHYVDPVKIPRYSIPSNLVLKDLQEFLFLIQNKQDANGTDIGGRRTPDEWKSKNPYSYEQLVIFYSLIGNFSSATTLVSGDYIRKFEQLIVSMSELNPIAFVRAYLGETEYQNVRIIPTQAGDSSFISLSDGKYTTPVLEMRSSIPEGSGNTFGQAQVDFDNVEFGQYINGVFIPETSDEIIVIKTASPVLSGYEEDDDGNVTVVGGEAEILHSLIADQIVESFDVIKQNWLNINFKLMHDRITESPNSKVIPVLENEFGTIMSQDLLSFNQLRDMYQRMAINGVKRYVDSGVLGIGVELNNQGDRNEDQSVFEKLVTNSQLSGIKKVNISNETLIEDEPIQRIDVEKVVTEINRRNSPNVQDIL